MNTPRDDMPEHDPAISALYSKTGDIEPPTSLDEAVLAAARRAVRQRRQRWILPLSTAAVLVLGITVLLKINSEWQTGDGFKEDAPVSIAREEMSDDASTGILAKRAAPASPEPQAQKAAPPSLATAPSEQARRDTRAKAEIAESIGFSSNIASMPDSTAQKAEMESKAKRSTLSGKAQDEQKTLGPKPWIEKIHKLVDAKNLNKAREELEAFKKRYPNYKLPDDLKSLIP